MQLLTKNLLLGMALASPPLFAEALAAGQARAPGAGVQLLLYWPFDFALLALASTAFFCLNVYGFRRGSAGWLPGAFTGLAAAALWFGATFLLVFQIHLWRGGQV